MERGWGEGSTVNREKKRKKVKKKSGRVNGRLEWEIKKDTLIQDKA